MAILNKETNIADALLRHPELIPVVNRLGVTLGVGQHTIGSLCFDMGMSPAFFLSVVNTFLDEGYFPADAQDTFTLGSTVDYLSKTASYYLYVQIPNIRRHFESLMARSGNDNNLATLYSYFEDTASLMASCGSNDENEIFPSLLAGVNPVSLVESVISHEEAETRLHDLLRLFIGSLKGECDRNLTMAVVSAISMLGKDYRQNNRIRRRILLPLSRARK